MSGAALLNLRSGAVCGVVVASKHSAHPDGALAEGQDSVKRLRMHEWQRIGRRKPIAASEHGIQTWAR